MKSIAGVIAVGLLMTVPFIVNCSNPTTSMDPAPSVFYIETFYLTAHGNGGNEGGSGTWTTAPKSLAHAMSPDQFCNAGNWSSSAQAVDNKIGPADLVLIYRDDGNITSSSADAVLIVQGSGTAGYPITIQGESGNNPVVDGENLRQAMKVDGRNFIIIDGVDFTRGDPFSLSAWDSNNCIVRNSKMFDSYGSNVFWYGDNNTIQYSEMHTNTTDHGIYFGNDSDNNVIEYCYIHDNHTEGAQFNSAGSPTTGNVVRYSWFENNGWADITDDTCDGLKIYGNIFYRPNSSLYHGIIMTGDGVGESARNTEIYNNVFFGDFVATIALGEGGEPTTGIKIKNNIFVNINGAANHYFIGRFTSASSISECDYNQFYNTNGIAINRFNWSGGGDTTPDSLSAWKTETGFDGHSSDTNPLFTNPGTDFTLQSTSPCIDAGTNVGLSQDRAGTPVPQGSGVDLGAFETRR